MLLGNGDCLGDGAEQRALRRIEQATGIELDDHGEDVGVLEQIGELPELCHVPGKVERIGAQPRKHPDIPLRCRRPRLVMHRE
jgi:hypothetical protein